MITQKVDNSTGSKIGNILFRSCHFKFKDGTTTAKIVQLNGAGDYTATSVAMQNNVFYASSEGTSVGAVLYANTKTVGHFLIEKNSLIGVYPLAAQGYIQNAPDKSSCFQKNVVYIKASSSTGSYTSGANFVSSSADPAVEPDAAPNFVDNVVFDNTDMKWKCFRNKAPSGIVNTIETKAGSPFIITNYDNGEFVLSDEYKGEYGAE